MKTESIAWMITGIATTLLVASVVFSVWIYRSLSVVASVTQQNTAAITEIVTFLNRAASNPAQ